MMSVFKRELRENAKWAAVICGMVILYFIHEMRDAEPDFLTDVQAGTIILGPLAGLLIGVVQTLFETRADNWAFTVHRPVDRLHGFVAKCAAGLLLLYAALGLPCLLVAAWAAVPGNLAMPFQWRMLWPLLVDGLGAGCFYFTGMVLTLRRARWLGSRVLVVGLALGTAGLTSLAIERLWTAVLILVVAQLVMAVAAWGVFAGGGAPWKGTGWAKWGRTGAARVALAAMIFPGAIVVGIVVDGIVQSFLPDREWIYYQVTDAGDFVRVMQSITSDPTKRSMVITDPEGRVLPQYVGIDRDDPSNSHLFLNFPASMVDERAVPWPLDPVQMDLGYRNPKPGVIRLHPVTPPGVSVRDVVVYDAQARIIDLYDPVMQILVGTVGPAGFDAAPAPPRARFPGELLHGSFEPSRRTLDFESVVYWIEMENRQVRPIFQAPAGDPVLAAVTIGAPNDPTVVVLSRQRVHLVQPSGKVILSAALDLDRSKFGFQPALMPGNHHLLMRAGPIPGAADVKQTLLEFDGGGHLVRQTQPPELHPRPGKKLPETAMLASMMPLALHPLLPNWILDGVVDLMAEEFPRMWLEVMIGSAIVSAVLALLISRRCGMGRLGTIGWVVGCFLFGPAAVVGMLGVIEWPARQKCAACGRARLLDRRDCTRCGTAMPAPAADGREIFEPRDELVAAV